GASGRSKTAFSGVRDALREHPVDIVLVQEAFHAHHRDHHQSDELAEALGYSAFYEPNKTRKVGHHGNTTLTPHRALAVQNFDISTNPIERRGALYVKLETPIGVVHVMNVHLGLNQRQRRRQLDAIGEIIGTHCPDGQPLILAGDFNDWNHRMDRVVRSELGLDNAFGELTHAPKTWPAGRPLLKLDRVYVRGLSPERTALMDGAPWNQLSDHLPLRARLTRP
ncbi:MAG: endonuclease/exonuclease/phosphatase family protein, partial [Myxococcota bacterium]